LKSLITALTKTLNFRREYIFSAAGVLCVSILLTAAFAQNNILNNADCLFENGTDQCFIMPQACQASSVLRGSLRPRRSVSQLRNNEFSKDIILSEKCFSPESKHFFIFSVSATVYFRHLYTKTSNPVRAGPVA
jgi:hypothetical protein